MDSLIPMILGLSGLVGLLFCFFGGTLYKFVILTFGLFSGSFGTYLLLDRFVEDFEYKIPVALIVGIIVAAIVLMINRIGLFIVGILLGILAGLAVTVVLNKNNEIDVQQLVIFSVAGGFMGGFISFIYSILVIRISTAFIGSFVALMSFFSFRNDNFSPSNFSEFAGSSELRVWEYEKNFFLFVLILGVLGFLFQQFSFGKIKSIAGLASLGYSEENEDDFDLTTRKSQDSIQAVQPIRNVIERPSEVAIVNQGIDETNISSNDEIVENSNEGLNKNEYSRSENALSQPKSALERYRK